MSYTSDILPDSLEVSGTVDGEILISFVCPRCGHCADVVVYELTIDSWLEISCTYLACVDNSKGQCIGYSFEFSLRRGIESASMLGLNDRPLNDIS